MRDVAAELKALRLYGMVGAWEEIVVSNRAVRGRARPEAGLRHLQVMRGFAGDAVRGVVRCYEGSNGMGAALIEFPLAARGGT